MSDETVKNKTVSGVACSFCGLGDDEIELLIQGKSAVYICDVCVSVCVDMLATEKATRARRDKLQQLRRDLAQMLTKTDADIAALEATPEAPPPSTPPAPTPRRGRPKKKNSKPAVSEKDEAL
jgi:hypothetical protein